MAGLATDIDPVVRPRKRARQVTTQASVCQYGVHAGRDVDRQRGSTSPGRTVSRAHCVRAVW